MVFLSGCPFHPSPYQYNQGFLPEQPVNMSNFNSPYDDFNVTAPVIHSFHPLLFSSNRNSQGGDFDIIYMPMSMEFDKNDGSLSVASDYEWHHFSEEHYANIEALPDIINNDANQYGPNLFSSGADTEYGYAKMHHFLYASDDAGVLNIFYSDTKEDSTFSDPLEVSFLNSNANDAYPTIDTAHSSLHFCSDRASDTYNIYSTAINPDTTLSAAMADTSAHDILKSKILSSSGNDKCPFVFKNIMVFTSDRAGGYGGYDLYLSEYVDGAWTQPANLGDKINTKFNEYRPVIVQQHIDNSRHMIIFSSDRPRGKGGYDLYFAGIQK
ncbi:MAG: hypothetical protein R6V32_07810 [Bacteroidales bacterium]